MRCGRGETKIDATGTPITGTSRRHEPLTARLVRAGGSGDRSSTQSAYGFLAHGEEEEQGQDTAQHRITSSVPTALSRGAEHFALASQVD
jgi:hypothetical protein